MINVRGVWGSRRLMLRSPLGNRSRISGPSRVLRQCSKTHDARSSGFYLQGATADRLVLSIADSVAASSNQPGGRVLHTAIVNGTVASVSTQPARTIPGRQHIQPCPANPTHCAKPFPRGFPRPFPLDRRPRRGNDGGTTVSTAVQRCRVRTPAPRQPSRRRSATPPSTATSPGLLVGLAAQRRRTASSSRQRTGAESPSSCSKVAPRWWSTSAAR